MFQNSKNLVSNDVFSLLLTNVLILVNDFKMKTEKE